MSKSVTLNRQQIDAFKAQWPCHGLPDNLHSIMFEFASNGDLVDMEAKARNGRILDTHDFNGPALVALCQDAQALGKQTLFRHLEIGQTFDFIDPAAGARNSFFEQCRKISARKYIGLVNGREYRIGSINARVFNVEKGAIAR
ncbi:hypothetical protein [Rhizobium phage RHph_X2_30]|nr:hypothetical protein [Rhizobium phage RHph_X2_30]